MPSLVVFHQFYEDLGLGVHNLDADDLRVMFTDTAPDAATDAVAADIDELAGGGGYASGGVPLINNAYSQVGGVGKLTVDDATFEASGGSVGPFRYAVLYNNSPVTKPLIGYIDRGDSVTLQDGEQVVLDASAIAGLIVIQ